MLEISSQQQQQKLLKTIVKKNITFNLIINKIQMREREKKIHLISTID